MDYNSVFLIVSAFGFLSVGQCNLFGVTQRVIVQGQLLCGTEPAKNIVVKLFDKDPGKDTI